jgi:hypothetical protein
VGLLAGEVGVLAAVGTAAVLLGWMRVGAGVAEGGADVCVGDGGRGVCVGVGDGCTFETVVGVLAGIEVTSRQAATKLANAPSAKPTKVRREMGRAGISSVLI